MTSEPGIFELSILLRMKGPMLCWLSCAPQIDGEVSHLLAVAPNNWPHGTPKPKSALQVREFTFGGSDVIDLARHMRDAGFGRRAPVVKGLPDPNLADPFSSSVSVDLLADITLCRTKIEPHPPPTSWRVQIGGTIFRGKDIEAFTQLVVMLLDLAEFDAAPIRKTLAQRYGVEGWPYDNEY
jgi:hypothetical protein